MSTRSAGAYYEDLALAHLQRQGLVLTTRNFSCRHGEIDLVMAEGDVVVFVEVRYRRGSASGQHGFGDGVDSITAAKRQKLVRAAGAYLAQARLAQRTCRFDVVAIAGDAEHPVLDWIKNAFDAC